MKAVFLSCIILFLNLSGSYSRHFEKWFSDGAMRVDYILAGNNIETNVYLSRLIHEPHWGGSKVNLIDTFGYGDYLLEISDALTGELIYSRGFGTLFREWQTVPESESLQRAFKNSLRFPYPKNKVQLELFLREKNHNLSGIFKMEIDPLNSQIEKFSPPDYKIYDLLINGPSESKVDIAILAEGYTAAEMKKFRKDAKHLMDYFFSVEPFSTEKHNFNVRLVNSPGKDSGTDLPHEGIWKETVLNSSFNTFEIERYLTTGDYWAVSDVASCVPYDQIIVLVNTDKYGGGGIFNFYSLTSSGHPASPGVLVHEFGHSFAGLADEYYTSDVSYQGFYNLQYEPWEPNITTLVDFGTKWEDMVEQDVPVPTPATDEFKHITGVFEGGGYVPNGIFRPQMDCIMKTNATHEFCAVCTRAIKRMIKFYAE